MSEIEFWTVGDVVREEIPGVPKDETAGVAVFVGNDDGPGEPVCFLHEDKGSHFENLPDADRNAVMIAAAPTIYYSLVRMTNMFRFVARHLGGEYAEEIVHAETVIRSVLSEDEQMADIERLIAEFAGDIQ